MYLAFRPARIDDDRASRFESYGESRCWSERGQTSRRERASKSPATLEPSFPDGGATNDDERRTSKHKIMRALRCEWTRTISLSISSRPYRDKPKSVSFKCPSLATSRLSGCSQDHE